MTKQKRFQKLKEKYDVEIVKIYDERNKGNYFIHEREPNCDGKGINRQLRDKIKNDKKNCNVLSLGGFGVIGNFNANDLAIL